ncbi:heme exporter protein CcmD [Paracoccus aestuariivivens]|uniref:Heme exporter protein D n=1 Tax=Paracoccus aestuariivivens TaxID=1820333 RepID=A0A6L6JHD9_9RHOB|nr:heme exporter protein CcmD [Paracoccus aestuariivivens]MTH79301.1 heme exporter protein CcmD [Paracoccus aestuariivivens]
MIELGKYATTVLSAYGISLVLLVAIVLQTVRANARARRALEEYDNRG